VKGDTFKGEVLVQRHHPRDNANPLFGGPNPSVSVSRHPFADRAAPP
jgi:hypothetical protein